MTMNSWKSTLLSAWAPPLRMFIIGTGRVLPATSPACGVEARQVCVERSTGRNRTGPRERHRHTERRVCAKTSLVGRAVERDHLLVHGALITVTTDDRFRDLAVDVPNRLEDAFSEIPLLVAVPKFQRLAHAG